MLNISKANAPNGKPYRSKGLFLGAVGIKKGKTMGSMSDDCMSTVRSCGRRRASHEASAESEAPIKALLKGSRPEVASP